MKPEPKRKPGRPKGSSVGEQKTELVAFRCTQHEREIAEMIGKGNASKGLRMALADYRWYD